ncbi:MAG: hypothetical protein A2511_02100 [Deltaproteobacteria bacterium RIFOXYD12_FULL_50_9]|nr:MAG: hypothetical protein A2511_02100 [Deltaproteobacteria bacterium RIFOXYD12_FULL_50_9]
MKIFAQIFQMIDLGLVILDKSLRIRFWNRWLESHSGIKKDDVYGKSLFEIYPHLNDLKFERNFKAVVTFGNFYFFSRNFHDYIFPFKPDSSFISEQKYMQQNCTMGPIRDETNKIQYAFITILDVTEAAIYEKKLTNALFANLDPDNKSAGIKDSVLTDLFTSASHNPFKAIHTLPGSTAADELPTTGDQIKTADSPADTPSETPQPRKSRLVEESPLLFQINQIQSLFNPGSSDILKSSPDHLKKPVRPKKSTVKKTPARRIKKTAPHKPPSPENAIKQPQVAPARNTAPRDVDGQIEEIFSIINFAVEKDTDETGT